MDRSGIVYPKKLIVEQMIGEGKATCREDRGLQGFLSDQTLKCRRPGSLRGACGKHWRRAS